MDENEQLEQHEKERRDFLSCLGSVIAGGVAAVAANSVSSQATAATQEATAASQAPAIPGYDWSKHQWAFGVDAEKCIGCLRCVEACKQENNVAPDAHHFRTWVERYVTLEGEDKARIDSQADPVNIEASGSEGRLSIRQSLQGCEGRKSLFRPQAVQSLHASGLCAGVPDRRDLQNRGWCGRHRSHLLHRLPILRAGLSVWRAILQRGKECNGQVHLVLSPHH